MLLCNASDYQMAAVLLRLPNVIRSEPYTYVNPHAHKAYIAHIQTQQDSDRILDYLIAKANETKDSKTDTDDPHAREPSSQHFQQDSATSQQQHDKPPPRTAVLNPDTVLRELGYMERFHIKEKGKTHTVLIPQCSLYANRGAALKHLNRMEYYALISHKEPSKTGSPRTAEFPYGEGFEVEGAAVQTILAKQKTPIVIRKPPRHPGKRPGPSDKRYTSWKKSADAYAEFFLTLFRPEIHCYEKKQKNTYLYTWEALEQFVSSLQQDSCIFSKFRLMAMHTRMKGYATTYRHKLILSKYRMRERDLWSKKQADTWAARMAWENKEMHINDTINETIFSAQHKNLSYKKNLELLQQLATAKNLTDAFCSTFDSEKQQKGKSPSHFPTKIRTNIHTPADSAPDIQFKATSIHRYDKEGVPLACETRKPRNQHIWTAFAQKLRQRRTVAKFKQRQREIFDVYKKYLDSPDNPDNHPPPVVLLHGGAGTGKSTVLKAILDQAEIKGRPTVRTAFNNINALHIKGETTFSLLKLIPDTDNHKLNGIHSQEIGHFEELLAVSKLIVVDEISTQAPWHLAKLSKACQQVKGNDLPFGGVPIILCGDLMQLEPVKAGNSFPAAIIDMCENVWCKPSEKHKQRMNSRRKTSDKPATNRYDPSHPYCVGASIIKHARLFELDEQVRAADNAAFVTKLYKCRPPTIPDMQNFEMLTSDDYASPNSPWFQAPIIVLTHRERYSLTHHAAIRFAKATGQPVIRWKSHANGWIQRPPEHLENQAFSDPCFYEYFVPGANGFITDNISKKLGLVNAQHIKCHSLTMTTDEEQNSLNYQIQTSNPGDVITLQYQPLSVNVQLDINHFTNEQLNNMEHFRLRFHGDNNLRPRLPGLPKPIPPTIIPISEGKTRVRKHVPVYGTADIRPSLVDIKPHFPFQLSFAMTINKSEGQTMNHAILALSHRQGSRFTVTFRHLYVACSRVRTRTCNRLLLPNGSNDAKWMSLDYLTTLKPPLNSLSVLRGFAARGGPGWRSDEWNPDLAMKHWEYVSQPAP